MKFGMRIPSLTRRISARTSVKRYLRHSMGLKVPRGFGWFTNPKRAAYNRIYRRTTFGIEDLFRKRRSSKEQGCGCLVVLLILWLLYLMSA